MGKANENDGDNLYNNPHTLMEAVEQSSIAKVAEFVIKDKERLNICDRISGVTPLISAIDNREILDELREIVQILLDNGADPNCVSGSDWGYKTPLMFAIDKGDAETVKMLLEAGADPYLRIVKTCTKYAEDLSPLTLAKRKATQDGYDKIIELLEEACKKKDLEYANEVCETLSSRNDREFIMDYIRSKIIDCGADVNMRDANGNTPLLALLDKYYDVIGNDADCRELKLLLENGANPNVCNNVGWTPLTETIWTERSEQETQYCQHYYWGADCTQVVKLLLEYGADFSYAMCADFKKASVVMQMLKEDYLKGVRELLLDKYSLNAE